MKVTLLNLANRLNRRAAFHGRRQHFIRERVLCWLSIAALELKWRLA